MPYPNFIAACECDGAIKSSCTILIDSLIDRNRLHAKFLLLQRTSYRLLLFHAFSLSIAAFLFMFLSDKCVFQKPKCSSACRSHSRLNIGTQQLHKSQRTKDVPLLTLNALSCLWLRTLIRGAFSLLILHTKDAENSEHNKTNQSRSGFVYFAHVLSIFVRVEMSQPAPGV